MGLKKIIPCLDIVNGRVVKGVNFKGIKEVADPVELAEYYNKQGADELVFYDIKASTEGRSLYTNLLKEISKTVDIPLVGGGGIKTVDDIGAVLESGADKVSINTGAIYNPKLISEGAKKYGSEKIVLAVDVKKNGDIWTLYTAGGMEDTGIEALEYLKKGQELGAGEIVVNSIDNDGVKQGFDIPLLKAVIEKVSIPVVASGGAGKKEDFAELFAIPGLDCGLAASIFHFKEVEISELKKYLEALGYEFTVPNKL